MKIAFFDSGIGGLTVLKEALKLFLTKTMYILQILSMHLMDVNQSMRWKN